MWWLFTQSDRLLKVFRCILLTYIFVCELSGEQKKQNTLGRCYRFLSKAQNAEYVSLSLPRLCGFSCTLLCVSFWGGNIFATSAQINVETIRRKCVKRGCLSFGAHVSHQLTSLLQITAWLQKGFLLFRFFFFFFPRRQRRGDVIWSDMFEWSSETEWVKRGMSLM